MYCKYIKQASGWQQSNRLTASCTHGDIYSTFSWQIQRLVFPSSPASVHCFYSLKCCLQGVDDACSREVKEYTWNQQPSPTCMFSSPLGAFPARSRPDPCPACTGRPSTGIASQALPPSAPRGANIATPIVGPGHGWPSSCCWCKVLPTPPGYAVQAGGSCPEHVARSATLEEQHHRCRHRSSWSSGLHIIWRKIM